MQIVGATLLLSPTNLTKHLACAHITTLDIDIANAEGRAEAPPTADDALGVVFVRGLGVSGGGKAMLGVRERVRDESSVDSRRVQVQ